MKVKQTLELDLEQLKALFSKQFGINASQLTIKANNKKHSDCRGETWSEFNGITVSFEKEFIYVDSNYHRGFQESFDKWDR